MPPDKLMEEIDYFDTIKYSAEGLYKDKGSKFLSYAYYVENHEEITNNLNALATSHPKAQHICYAYRFGSNGEEHRINDDGEPSGTGGKPIYNELLSRNLTNTLLAVIRYFGGTKLGVPGLIQAYKSASKDALDKTEIIRKYLTESINLYYPGDKMGFLYSVLKKHGIYEIQNKYSDSPYMQFELRKSQKEAIIKSIVAEYHGYSASDLSSEFESKELIFKTINL